MPWPGAQRADPSGGNAAADGVAERRLAQSYTVRSAANVPLIHESFKGKEETQIKATDIHRGNIAYNDHPSIE